MKAAKAMGGAVVVRLNSLCEDWQKPQLLNLCCEFELAEVERDYDTFTWVTNSPAIRIALTQPRNPAVGQATGVVESSVTAAAASMLVNLPSVSLR